MVRGDAAERQTLATERKVTSQKPGGAVSCSRVVQGSVNQPENFALYLQ